MARGTDVSCSWIHTWVSLLVSVWNPLSLDPSNGVFNRSNLAALLQFLHLQFWLVGLCSHRNPLLTCSGVVLSCNQVRNLHPLLRLYAELPEDVPLEVYEEVKSEPTIIVDMLNPDQQLQKQPAQLEDGDILVFQIAMDLDEEEKYRFAHVKEFLTYKVARREVTFRKVTDPGEEGFKLELLKDMSYDAVSLGALGL